MLSPKKILANSSILLLISAFWAVTTAHAGTVTVIVNGVTGEGPLYVTLQTEDDFMTRNGYSDMESTPSEGTVSFEFEDVAPGTYALSIWHDINNNGTFDMNEYGMPADGWAMSNAQNLRGAPTFDVVSFEIDAAGATLEEDMYY